MDEAEAGCDSSLAADAMKSLGNPAINWGDLCCNISEKCRWKW